MYSVEQHGMMTIENPAANIANLPNFYLAFDEQPKGTLYIKNLNTGVEKRISVSKTEYGTLIWEQSVDDPTYTSTDLFTVEFSGKCGRLNVGSSTVWTGSGSASISGVVATNGG